jgi:hypothetical protein
VELDLNEVPLQSATLDAAQDELASDDEEEVARLRALEMSEFLITVEEVGGAGGPGCRDRG